MTALEKIALTELRKQLSEISTRIEENKATPERQVQHVLPFMNVHLIRAFDIIKAIEDHQ